MATPYKSDGLYFSNYRDCGDGILEFTSVIHNAADDVRDGYNLIHLNVPWGGTRESVLRDVITSDNNGDTEVSFPPKYFGEGQSTVNVEDTGGFTIFTEEVVIPDDVYNQYQFEVPNNYRLIISKEPSAIYSPGHSAQFDSYCMSVRIEMTPEALRNGCRDCDLLFTNSRTEEAFYVSVVIHWSWEANKIYFCSEEITSDEFSARWLIGDEILVDYANFGKPMEDNLCLSFVHGFEGNLARVAHSRIRYGKTGVRTRDYTVYVSSIPLHFWYIKFSVNFVSYKISCTFGIL